MDQLITKNILKFIDLISKKGGKVYAVKDFALSEVLRRFGYDSLSDNLDIEIYGINKKEIETILKNKFSSFKKAKNSYFLDGIEITIPRISIQDSAKKKGIILDAFFLDLKTGKIKDYFEGIIDVQKGLIRYTAKDIFQADIFNVFRVIQLASQLEFRIDKRIIDLEISFSADRLKKDFLFSYWKDLLLNSSVPSIGMEYLKEMNILSNAHIEINSLVGIGQNPEWHQEGDAWVHTKMVVDAGARICRLYNLNEEDSLILMLSCLCHDLGKPIVAKIVNGRINARGHEKEGEIPTRIFLEKIGAPKDIIKKVSSLVSEHMFTHSDKFTKEEVVSLAKRIHPVKIKDLVYLAEADCEGMVNCKEDNNARNYLLEMANRMGIE